MSYQPQQMAPRNTTLHASFVCETDTVGLFVTLAAVAVSDKLRGRKSRVLAVNNLRTLVAALIGLFAIYFPTALWLDRSYVEDRPAGQIVIPLYRPFTPITGNAFTATLLRPPDAKKLAELSNNPAIADDNRSPFVIFEGNAEVGRGNVAYQDIVTGFGRYNNWPAGLVFSASDNTNPNTNGRTYWAVVPYAKSLDVNQRENR